MRWVLTPCLMSAALRRQKYLSVLASDAKITSKLPRLAAAGSSSYAPSVILINGSKGHELCDSASKPMKRFHVLIKTYQRPPTETRGFHTQLSARTMRITSPPNLQLDNVRNRLSVHFYSMSPSRLGVVGHPWCLVQSGLSFPAILLMCGSHCYPHFPAMPYCLNLVGSVGARDLTGSLNCVLHFGVLEFIFVEILHELFVQFTRTSGAITSCNAVSRVINPNFVKFLQGSARRMGRSNSATQCNTISASLRRGVQPNAISSPLLVLIDQLTAAVSPTVLRPTDAVLNLLVPCLRRDSDESELVQRPNVIICKHCTE
ncbi:hypothetical protein BD410DRAFT_616733 [Rickenella mellea]|uniref:Uncharacterized protein n=1 Tax=Rickenella mellea TaxID=50990 RepID=A0A4Y7PNB8_9AGAM|nr:hypothetical protein BD410DRAFT_616733 [Rickenella mellea]